MSKVVPSTIALRAETGADGDFLRDLYASTRAEEMDLLDWTPAQKRDFLAMQFHAQTTHYADFYPEAERAIIECGGVPIGRLYIDRREGEIEIIDIALLPEMRGRGIGKALLADVIAESRASARRLRIYVEHFNPARGLYDRLGFRQVGTNGVYHELELAAR